MNFIVKKHAHSKNMISIELTIIWQLTETGAVQLCLVAMVADTQTDACVAMRVWT